MKTEGTILKQAIVVKFTYHHEDEIDFKDIVLMFDGIASEFEKFKDESALKSSQAETLLIIREIKKGSIILTISALVPLILACMGNINTIFDFFQKLKNLFKRKNNELSQSEFENYLKINEVIKNNPGSRLEISTNEGVNNSIVLNSERSREINLKSKSIMEKIDRRRNNIDLIGSSLIAKNMYDSSELFKKEYSIVEVVEKSSEEYNIWIFKVVNVENIFEAVITDDEYLIKVKSGCAEIKEGDLLKVNVRHGIISQNNKLLPVLQISKLSKVK